MNYQKHYDNLIKTRKALDRKKYKGVYYEKHHIVMKSMGGTNDKDNLILLTAKEHYIAHLLLWKIHRNRETAYSLFRLCNYSNDPNVDRICSSRGYEHAQSIASKYLSKQFKEQWKDPKMRKRLSEANSKKNKGRVHTKEARKNMSIRQTGAVLSKETREKISKNNTGQKRTAQQRLNMSKAQKGKIISEQGKLNMSIAAKTRKQPSGETREKMIAKMSISKKKPRKKYKLISPNNNIYICQGIKEIQDLAKKFNLSYSILKNNRNKGKIKSSVFTNHLEWELRVISSL